MSIQRIPFIYWLTLFFISTTFDSGLCQIRKDLTHAIKVGGGETTFSSRTKDTDDACLYRHMKGDVAWGFFHWSVGAARVDVWIDPAASEEFRTCKPSDYPMVLTGLQFLLADAHAFQIGDGEGVGTFMYQINLYYPKTDKDPCSLAGDLIYEGQPQTVEMYNSGFTNQVLSFEKPIIIDQPFFLSYKVLAWTGLSHLVPTIVWDNETRPSCVQFISQDDGASFVDQTELFGEAGLMDFNLSFNREALLDTIPPTIIFEDVESVFSANYDYEGYVNSVEDDKITGSIRCYYRFPEDYYRFPEPVIQDNLVGVVAVSKKDSVDTARVSVTRTWKAQDQAGNITIFEFTIAFDNAADAVNIDLVEIKTDDNDTSIFLYDDSSESVCLGQALTLSASARNACSDAIDYYWYLDNDDVPDKIGETIEHSWDQPGTFTIKIVAEGRIFNGSGQLRAEVAVGGPDFIVKQVDVSCAGLEDGSLVLIPGKNVSGFEWGNGSTEATLSDLSEGEYHVSIWDARECYVSQKFTIVEPEPLDAELFKSDVTCHSASDGTVEVKEITGGTPPYRIAWLDVNSNVKLGSDELLINLGPGEYKASISDSRKCLYTELITIEDGDPNPKAGFTIANADMGLTQKKEVVFTNTSTGASTFQWQFGDSSTLSSADQIITHVYRDTGTFIITLSAITAKGCKDSVTKTLTIEPPITALADDHLKWLSLYPNPCQSKFTLIEPNGDLQVSEIMILNSTGQRVHQIKNIQFENGLAEVQIDQVPPGVLFLVITTNKNTQFIKRLVHME